MPPFSPSAAAIPPQILALAAIVLIFLTALGVMLHQALNGPRARLKRRIGSVIGSPAKGGRSGKGGKANQGGRKKSIQSKLREVESSRSKARGYKLREQLQQAGLTIGIKDYVLLSVLMAAVSGGAWYAMSMPLPGLPFFIITMGVGFPKFVVGTLVKRRQKKFTQNFAEAIDILVRGIRSGLPVGECLTIIGREMPDPVGPEFKLIVEGQRLGMTLEEAMGKAVIRMPTSELKYFAIVLSIQQQTGGNLADTLAKLSDVLRSRKRMRDRIQAMSSEAKSSAGIIGSLPVIVGGLLSVIAPDYISTLFFTDTGHLLLGIGACIMGFGVFVMRQMINFDI